MRKKQPPRPNLKKGKAARATSTPGRAKAKSAPTKKAPRPRAKPRMIAAAASPTASEMRLEEAMEELVVARQELSRLGHELTASHREIEDRKLSAESAEDHLREQMMAVREELRTALAELEISRNEIERLRKKLAQNEAASASKKPVGSSPSV
jgi:chromosome segregation ATPase